jgi:hypothetical protein
MPWLRVRTTARRRALPAEDGAAVGHRWAAQRLGVLDAELVVPAGADLPRRASCTVASATPSMPWAGQSVSCQARSSTPGRPGTPVPAGSGAPVDLRGCYAKATAEDRPVPCTPGSASATGSRKCRRRPGHPPRSRPSTGLPGWSGVSTGLGRGTSTSTAHAVPRLGLLPARCQRPAWPVVRWTWHLSSALINARQRGKRDGRRPRDLGPARP